MRFKATLDTTTLFYIGIVLIFPTALSYNAFDSGNTALGIAFAVLGFVAFAFAVYDLLFSAYIFEGEHIFYKARLGRERIRYESIIEAHIRQKDGKTFLYLSIGRRYPHKVRVKDVESFLNELRRRKPDLVEEMGD